MIHIRKKIFCLILLSSFLLISFSTLVSAEEIEIADDQKRDLRLFDEDVLEEDIDVDFDDLDDLDDVREDLFELWNKGTNTDEPSRVDIIGIIIDVGDASGNSTFTIELREVDNDEPILILIFGEYDGEDDFVIYGMHGSFDIDGDMGYNESIYTNYYYGVNYDTTSVEGEMDFSNDEIELEFPTNWIQDDPEEDCEFIILVITEEDDEFIADICPNFETALSMSLMGLFEFPNLLLYAVIGAILISIQVYARRKAIFE